MKRIFFYPTRLGKIGISELDGGITSIYFAQSPRFTEKIEETELIRKTLQEIEQYLEGNRREFTFPMNPIGTEFQKKVWTALRDIPYGEVRSYKEIAEAVGCPKGARAVGLANNKNPIVIATPCHRVIGANGKLVGYAYGLEMKKELLALENKI